MICMMVEVGRECVWRWAEEDKEDAVVVEEEAVVVVGVGVWGS